MENNDTKKPTEGTWENMTPSGERKPKIEFEKDKTVIVSFSEDFKEPKEFNSTDGKGVYYLFDCIEEGEDKIFMTSAWSLLQGLKDFSPLANKTIAIKKGMKDAKQHYTVEEVVPENEEEVPVVKPGE